MVISKHSCLHSCLLVLSLKMKYILYKIHVYTSENNFFFYRFLPEKLCHGLSEETDWATNTVKNEMILCVKVVTRKYLFQ